MYNCFFLKPTVQRDFQGQPIIEHSNDSNDFLVLSAAFVDSHGNRLADAYSAYTISSYYCENNKKTKQNWQSGIKGRF